MKNANYKQTVTAPIFEELEPRLLFSADGAEALALPVVEQEYEEPVVTADQDTTTEPAAVEQPANVQQQEPAVSVLPTDAPLSDRSTNEDISMDQPVLEATATNANADVNTDGPADTNDTAADPATDTIDGEALQAQASAVDGENDFQSTPPDQIKSDAADSGGEPLADVDIRHELVLINDNVKDSGQLISSIEQEGTAERRDIEVVVIDDRQDGITQVSDILSDHHDLDAVHIISHGGSGSLALGEDWLHTDDLITESTQITEWGKAFNDEGDILLYGCSIGHGEDGHGFVDTLAQLTGADVAASVNQTGSSSLGGDWRLEYSTGTIEAYSPVSRDEQQNWNHLLSETIADNFDAVSYGNNDGTHNWNNDWQEINDHDDGPASGNVAIYEENTWGQGLEINHASAGAWREADLSDTATATLTFDWGLIKTEAGDSVTLEISTDGGNSWATIDSYEGPADDGNLHAASYDISPYLSSATQIKFETTTFGDNDKFFVDNIYINLDPALSTTPEFRVNTTTSDLQETIVRDDTGSDHAVVMDAAGNYVVVWSSWNQDGSGWGVYGQRFNAAGGTLGNEFLINESTTQNQNWASVAMADDGRFAVTWTSQDQGNNATSVYARRFAADGTAADHEFRVPTYTQHDQSNSTIAMEANGDFIIAWQGNGPGDSDGIYFRRFDANGSAIDATDKLANQSDSDNEHNPVVAMQVSGKFVIAWDQGSNSYFQRFDASGSSLGPETKINGKGFLPTTSSDLAVATDASGNFTFVCREDTSFVGGVYHRGFNADGTERYSYSKIASGDAASPSITMDDAGNYLVVYEKTGDGNGLGVYGRWYDSTGSALNSAFLINETTSGNQQMISTAMLDINNYVAVWTGNGSGDDMGVYARQFGTTPAHQNSPPTGSVVINGTATEDQTLTVSNTLDDADGLGTVSYQWLRDGADITGATATSYVLGDDDVGRTITVQASYIDGQGTHESITSDNVGPVVNVNDAPAGLPVITGTAEEDQTLTADTSGISDDDGLGTFSYQWRRNGSNISGATAATYTLGDADVGARIRVRIRYIDGHGTLERATSIRTSRIANINDDPTGEVTINNMNPAENDILTADTSGINDDDGLGTFNYQWRRNGSNISGATAATYTLDDADVGSLISVQVSYTDGQGTDESVTSSQTAAVTNVNDAPTGLPTISGSVTEGQTLTANTNDISDDDGLGTFSYQWRRNESDISGATSVSYTLDTADVGTHISVQVNYTDGHGTTEILTSTETAPVTNINNAPTGVPTISGTATENETLTADTSGISDDDGLGVFSYQWLRDATAITGATANTYTLNDEDIGSQISVQVSYTDGQGTAEGPLTSAETGPVANVNDDPTGLPVITGTATENETLIADTSGISDDDGLGTFSYQWRRNESDISGATAATYSLGDADVGALIRVQVSYTDGHGTDQSITSDEIGPVINVNDVPAGSVAIDNMTPAEDDILTAANTLDDDDGMGVVSYQWQRDGIDITGATESTYTIVQADVSHMINVVAEYTDGHGTDEQISSAVTAVVYNRNDPPVGNVIISGTATEDQTLTVGNTLSDADGMGTVTYQWQRDGADINGATATTYVLGDDDVGATITVIASYTDGQGTRESIISDSVGPVANINDAPTLTAIDYKNIDELEALTFTADATDVDLPADTLTYTLDATSLDAGMTINAATGAFSWTPAEDQDGEYLVTMTVTDADGLNDSSTFTITVNDVNVAPTVAHAIDDQTASEDSAFSFRIADNTFYDADGDTLTYTIDSDASGWLSFDAATRTFSGTPLNGDVGPHTITVTAADGHGGTVSDDFTLMVANTNDTPSAVADNGSTSVDTAVTTTNVLANDDPGDGLVGITGFDATSTHDGTVTSNDDGTFTYTPATGFSGTDSFSYTIADTDGETSTAIVTMTVAPATDSHALVGETRGPQQDTANPGSDAKVDTTGNDSPPVNDETPAAGETEQKVIIAVEENIEHDTGIDHGPESGQSPAKTTDADDETTMSEAVTDAKKPHFSRAAAQKGAVLPSGGITVHTPTEAPATVEASGNKSIPARPATQHRQITGSSTSILLQQYLNKVRFEGEMQYTRAFEQLQTALDDFRKEAASDSQYYKTVIGSAIAVSTGLSVGYVVWLIRGGMLMSSVLFSMPAWQLADPLPLLNRADDNDDEKDDESLEKIIENGSRKKTKQKKTAGNDNEMGGAQ